MKDLYRRLGRIVAACVAFLAVAAAVPGALAQSDYPNRSIRFLVGFPPGSAADITARLVGNKMGQILGQQIVIENKPGAGSSIAGGEAARAPKDGYTLYLGTSGNTANAAFAPNLTFDFKTDFIPITPLVTVPLILVVHPSLGVKSVADLIKLAKAKPGELSYASPGIGTASHFGGELLKSLGGVNVTHIPYQGSPQAITDLIAGRTSLIFSPSSTVMGHIQAGRLVALASGGTKRPAVAPDLPTMVEAGVADFDITTWFGLVAPAGTPKAVIDKLSAAANEALKSDEVKAGLAKAGFDPIGGPQPEFAAFVERDLVKWAKAAELAGLRKK